LQAPAENETLSDDMAITLRDVLEADEAFLREVYAGSRAEEMALVPWSDEQREAFLRMQFDAQHSYYHAQFPTADYKVILENTEPIGRIYIHRTEEIRVLDITILPAHRNRGLGSAIIRKLMVEGSLAGKAVSIWVEHFNPSRKLFDRLGFSQIQKDGYNLLMEWRPSK
jgi:RimJ/RimL family protein N-acetyltransferase